MKKLLFICLALLAASCSQNKKTHSGEVYMGEFTTVQLEENLDDKNVTAVVTLKDPLVDAELWIDDYVVATFNGDGEAYFTPSKYGDVPCVIKSEGKEYHDNLKLYIETWYVKYNSSGENGDIRTPIENGVVVLTPSNVTLGSCDMIWAYDLRVPKDKTITFDYDSVKLAGDVTLAVHFRLDDYADRYDLYPDEPYVAKYIDAETDKWISAPITLEHGVYTLYVCPNEKTDKNYITVTHSSEYSNSGFAAYYKSILVWPLK